MDRPERPVDPGPPPALGTGRKPRTRGTEAAVRQIQVAMGLFLLLLFLLMLWIAWPILTNSG